MPVNNWELMKTHLTIVWILLGVTGIALTACTVADDTTLLDCSADHIHIAPTATRPSDPNLAELPSISEPDAAAIYCPTEVPHITPMATTPSSYIATDVVNLSLSETDQSLVATAVGDDMLAVAWLTDGDITIALARGGSHFQVRRLDAGSAVAMAFSTANRLHVAYEQAGSIQYRAADAGQHPADSVSEFIASGSNPALVLNQFNYAQIVFSAENQLHHAAQIMTGSWAIASIVGAAETAHSPQFIGTNSGNDLSYLVSTVGAGGELHLSRWTTTPYGFFPSWEQLVTVPATAGETVLGSVGLAYAEESGWAVASWVTVRPHPQPPLPSFVQPHFAAANPLYPDQIANPSYLHSGLNAARWHSDLIRPQPFSGGLQQTFNVPNPTGQISASAWGLGESSERSSVTTRLGIDPTGGSDPASATVVWSAPVDSPILLEQTLAVTAQGSTATLFLEGTQMALDSWGVAVWDALELNNGVLVNPDFEESFTDGIPNGWTPYWADSGTLPVSGRDLYTAYAIWSEDGGTTWQSPVSVAVNRDAGGSLSGALGADIMPLISTQMSPPTVTFAYLYAAGDPPANSTFLRFGRPYTSQCAWPPIDCPQRLGQPLLARTVVQPSITQRVVVDPHRPNRALLVWDALQSDLTQKDVFATHLVLR